MSMPVIACVDDDDADRATVMRELSARYDADYTVVEDRTPRNALRRLETLRDEGTEVALILAAHHLAEMPGAEFLAAAHALHPTARRGLLIDWGEDRSARGPIMRACALGQSDHYLARPVEAPDEHFHRAITEFLDEWWRLRGREFEVMRVVGEERSARSHEVRDLLSRNDVPYGFYPVDSSGGRALLREVGLTAARLPVLVTTNGPVLVDPTNREVGQALGASGQPDPATYDVTIVGGGPAGLAAAVSAASEGLRTTLLEHQALGGQAGTSSLIRNYLGFPRGISGAELASRAFEQARLFGADVVYGNAATALRADGDLRVVTLADGSEATSRTVIVATGVSYRRLDVVSLESLVGSGVFYGAAVAEAPTLEGDDVFVVGGGNSAGQAALHLAKFARRVTIVVRSDSLAASMSEYLVAEISRTPNIEIRHGFDVTDGGGEGRLEWLTLRARDDGTLDAVGAAALFVLIGAEPFTDWLPDKVVRDNWGYVVTGTTCGRPGCALHPAPSDSRRIQALETTMPGVFAVGDVRHGSIKRVAAATGEGSTCIPAVHEYLSEARHHGSD